MIKIFDFKSDRLHGLDHLRALAIVLVMTHHYRLGMPTWLEPVRNIGWTGVDLFFVLSGYLMGYQLLKEIKETNNISFKRFYLKRFFRIIPAYIVVLILYYSLKNYKEGTGMPPLLKFLTFTQNFGLDVLHGKSFSHAWSLCIEEQFYLLLPITILIIFLFKIQSNAIYLIVILIIIGFILRLYNWYQYIQPFIESGDDLKVQLGFLENIYYPSYNRMDGLLFGVSIAAILNFKPKFMNYISRYGNFVLLIGIGIFILAYNVCNHFLSFNTAIYGYTLVSFAYGLIVMAALCPSCILYKLKSKTTFVIATLSYVVYLSHKQLFHLIKLGIDNIGIDSQSTWLFWICLIIAGLGGLVLHLVIEKPFLQLRDKILSKESFARNESYRNLMLNTIIVKNLGLFKRDKI
jgi:peptidoglycan/LPS O-acetylase OafA/YrhL